MVRAPRPRAMVRVSITALVLPEWETAKTRSPGPAIDAAIFIQVWLSYQATLRLMRKSFIQKSCAIMPEIPEPTMEDAFIHLIETRGRNGGSAP